MISVIFPMLGLLGLKISGSIPCRHSAILLTGAFFRGRGTTLTQRPPSYSPAPLTLYIVLTFTFLFNFLEFLLYIVFLFVLQSYFCFGTTSTQRPPSFSPAPLTLTPIFCENFHFLFSIFRIHFLLFFCFVLKSNFCFGKALIQRPPCSKCVKFFSSCSFFIF